MKTISRTEGKLVLYSLNPVYEPYEVHINEVKEIWKFVNYISNEIPDPVLPEKQLIQAVAGMKHDLERIKARLGKDISDMEESEVGSNQYSVFSIQNSFSIQYGSRFKLYPA